MYLFDGKIQEKDTSYNERGKLKRERKKKQGVVSFLKEFWGKKDTSLVRKGTSPKGKETLQRRS